MVWGHQSTSTWKSTSQIINEAKPKRCTNSQCKTMMLEKLKATTYNSYLVQAKSNEMEGKITLVAQTFKGQAQCLKFSIQITT